jgi:hypothetical protein
LEEDDTAHQEICTKREINNRSRVREGGQQEAKDEPVLGMDRPVLTIFIIIFLPVFGIFQELLKRISDRITGHGQV